jgi:hypothetical protein
VLPVGVREPPPFGRPGRRAHLSRAPTSCRPSRAGASHHWQPSGRPARGVCAALAVPLRRRLDDRSRPPPCPSSARRARTIGFVARRNHRHASGQRAGRAAVRALVAEPKAPCATPDRAMPRRRRRRVARGP